MRAAPERRAPERSGAANAGRHAGARSRPAGRRRIRHMYKEWDCRPGWAASGQATMAVCWSLSNIRRSARLRSARLGSARNSRRKTRAGCPVFCRVVHTVFLFAPLQPENRARFNTTRAAQQPDDGDEQRLHEGMRSDPAGTGISPGVPSAAVPATGKPDSAPQPPAPDACTPTEAPTWFRNSRNTGL